MSFRTASSTQNRQTLLDLQRTEERLGLNQTRIATGKRITNPGDDPAASALILDFSNSIEANNQYVKQADSAISFLTSAEGAVTSAIDSNTRLQELAQQGLASSGSAGARSAIISEIDSIRTNLLAMANTQDQGKYIFAGAQTQTVPFVDAAPPASPNYVGDEGSIKLNVTAAGSVVTNVPGDRVFFGAGGRLSSTDVFQAIADLRAGLSSNNLVQIQTAADHFKSVLDNLNQVQADLGGRQAGLLALKDTLTGFNVSLQGMQSAQEDTNYPQAMTQFSSDQTMQSATLSALAKTTRTNLFDYLA